MGGRGPKRLPCQGWAGNAGGGMAGRKPVPPPWPPPLPPLPPLPPARAAACCCPAASNQGFALFHPAGKATEVGAGLLGTCGVQIPRSDKTSETESALYKKGSLTSASDVPTRLGIQACRLSTLHMTALMLPRVARGLHNTNSMTGGFGVALEACLVLVVGRLGCVDRAGMQQAHEVLINLAPAAAQVGAGPAARDQPRVLLI